MQRKFGKSIAQKIDDCLDFMETAIDFGEVCQDKSYRVHRLKGVRSEQYSFRLDNQFRLVVELVKYSKFRKRTIDIDRLQETTIQIIEIVDYH